LGFVTGGPRRLVLPALKLKELPKIDLVLLSHAHFDHLCRPTLNKMDKTTRVVTAENTQDLVRDLGFDDVSELRWGESLDVGPVKLTARKVRHWGARTFNDNHRGFNAYLLESGRRRVLFGGDTAYCDYFSDLPKVDLAILGIGGYFPAIHCHANPEQAWEMAGQMRAEHILPMHHSTFRLGMEPVHEPMERMMEAAGKDRERVVVREVGGTYFA
jgi:L-ascorbate metabolism protein UlaG (beta-lactamase superfamily)